MHHFICCVEAFQFDIVPHAYFCFWCQIQTIIPQTNMKELTAYVLFLEFYVLMFKFLIHFGFIFVLWYNVGVQLYSFACGNLIFHLLKILFFLIYSWLLCHKVIDHIHVGLYLGSLFCSIDLCVCFYVSSILF